VARRVERSGRWGSGGWVAVASIVALGSACLAGSPLYLSSVATAAVHSELAHTCLADVGLQIWMDGTKPDSDVRLSELSAPLAAHTQPGVLTRIAYRVGIKTEVPGVPPVGAFVMYRDGQEQNLLRSVTPPGIGEVLAPEWLFPPGGTRPGDVLALSTTDGQGIVNWSRTVRVVDTYPLVPTRPEAAYWCGLRSFFRSRTSDPADAPTPVLFGTSDEVRTAGSQIYAVWELRPDPKGLSRHDAAVLAGRFDQFAAKVAGPPAVDARGRVLRVVAGGDPLRVVVRHAETATAVVAGTMAPVRLVGLLASLTLLIAATTLMAREQQRELRLRLLKGQSPASLGLRVARSAGGAVIVGTLAGGACALAAVRFFGPAAEFETAAVRSAIEYVIIGSVVAVVVIACAAAARARMFVDASTRTRSWVRLVPWELVPVAAAIVTFTRLDRIGGIQQIGAKVAHADFLAQCFPLMAIIAPLSVLARPTLALLRRWRLAGRRLPPALMTGLRRSLAEPTVTAAVLLATALAAGSFTLARLLTDSNAVLLQDKATTFLGSDLSIVSRDVTRLPPPFDATGTIVARAQGHSGAQAIDLIGIDGATFARAVHWRADASTDSLDELVGALRPAGGATPGAGDPMPAVVVGGTLPDTHLESVIHRPFQVQPIATARWFPGLRNGAILVVVDADALRALIPTSTEIWLRDPPTDAVSELSAAGLAVRSPRDLTQVFDVTSFLTVRWAYATLSMLAALVGIVVLLTQLLVLDARRQNRQAAHVLTTRMGLTARGEAIGLVAELAPALVSGAGLGVLIGWIVSRASVARLDSLRQLRPPARLIAEPSTAVPLVAGVAGCLVVLVAVGVVMVRRTRVMEVMRGTA
jgi:putative ABC transport system permease protein